MCIGENFTVRRRPNRARSYHLDDVYYGQHYPLEQSYQADPLVHQQPYLGETMPQRFPPDIQPGNTYVPRNRHRPFGFRMPFTRKSTEPRQDHCMHARYCSKGTPCDELAGYPDNIELEYRSPRHPHPIIRRVSPKETSHIVQGKQQTHGMGSLLRGRITGTPPPKSRPRRERTPSCERIHLRRRCSAPARGVEIDSHRPVLRQESNQERARGFRQVRFVGDDDDVDRGTRKAFEGPTRGQHRSRRELHWGDSFAQNGDGYDITPGDPRQSRPTRNSRLQSHTREDREPRNHTPRDAPRIRPRIIQDGRRYLSETGVRVCMAGRAGRPGQDRRSPHFEPSDNRRARYSPNDFDGFDFERIHNSRSHRQPYRRSHWR